MPRYHAILWHAVPRACEISWQATQQHATLWPAQPLWHAELWPADLWPAQPLWHAALWPAQPLWHAALWPAQPLWHGLHNPCGMRHCGRPTCGLHNPCGMACATPVACGTVAGRPVACTTPVACGIQPCRTKPHRRSVPAGRTSRGRRLRCSPVLPGPWPGLLHAQHLLPAGQLLLGTGTDALASKHLLPCRIPQRVPCTRVMQPHAGAGAGVASAGGDMGRPHVGAGAGVARAGGDMGRPHVGASARVARAGGDMGRPHVGAGARVARAEALPKCAGRGGGLWHGVQQWSRASARAAGCPAQGLCTKQYGLAAGGAGSQHEG